MVGHWRVGGRRLTLQNLPCQMDGMDKEACTLNNLIWCGRPPNPVAHHPMQLTAARQNHSIK